MARWIFAGLLLIFTLTGCDTVREIIGTGPEEVRLTGKRISVLALDSLLEPDPEISNQAVSLPRPHVNLNWPQIGGNAPHVMQHLAAKGPLEPMWSRDVGSGETKENLILSPPVIAEQILFTIDSRNVVTATHLITGETLWQANTVPKAENVEGALGGGLAYNQETLYVSTPYGYALALNPLNGGIYWWRRLGAPIRSPPVVDDGRVFIVTVDNKLYALNYRDGNTLWEHAGIAETAGLLGTAPPAIAGDMVIVPYSSGELFAMRVENGRISWSDTLTIQGRLGASTVLNDIDASPVVHNNTVYSISHSGRLVAIDLYSGLRIWEQEISGTSTPWLAGNYLFLTTANNNLVCIQTTDGRIRWVSPVPDYLNPDDQEDPIDWTRPILLGDRLIMASSHGEVRSVSPYTGRMLGSIKLRDGIRVPPIVADETLYILTSDAKVIALR